MIPRFVCISAFPNIDTLGGLCCWRQKLIFSILLGGIMPFAIVFLELFFILKSMWQDQFYYMFGFLYFVLALLFVSCIEITLTTIYFQLCAEDYRWHWKSFAVSSASTIYVFLFSIYYYVTRMGIDSYMVGLIYFSNVIGGCGIYALVTGTFGVLCTYAFVVKIYSAVKID